LVPLSSHAIGAGVVVALQPRRIRVATARHVVDNGPVTIWIDGRPWGDTSKARTNGSASAAATAATVRTAAVK
jgi:hypothetical protein